MSESEKKETFVGGEDRWRVFQRDLLRAANAETMGGGQPLHELDLTRPWNKDKLDKDLNDGKMGSDLFMAVAGSIAAWQASGALSSRDDNYQEFDNLMERLAHLPSKVQKVWAGTSGHDSPVEPTKVELAQAVQAVAEAAQELAARANDLSRLLNS